MASRSASQACSTLSTPARADAMTDSDPWAWLMTRRPCRCASDTIARISDSVSSGSPWTSPAGRETGRREHRRLRRDDLDDVGPVADLAPNGTDQLGFAIRFDAELMPVTAGDADRGAGGDEPRSGHVARGDRVAEDQLEVPDRSRAAGGRRAGPQRPGRMARRGQEDLGVGSAGDRRDRALGRVEGVVGMRVDQPGEQRPAATGDDRRRRARPGAALTGSRAERPRRSARHPRRRPSRRVARPPRRR